MDIEGDEWKILKNFAETSNVLNMTTQLALEVLLLSEVINLGIEVLLLQ